MKLRHVLFFVLLAGCSSEPDDSTTDAADAATADMTSTADMALADARPATDAGPDASLDVGGGCVDDCATLDFTATVGPNTATFDQAIYGVTAPAQAASGAWEVHVEVHAGGAGGCPTMDSPSPDQTVIITNIPVPSEATSFGESEGLVVSMLDFAGTVTDELPLTAEGESLQWVAWQVCTDCTDDDPAGFLSFDVTAPVAGGMIGGHVYATHCASLDAR